MSELNEREQTNEENKLDTDTVNQEYEHTIKNENVESENNDSKKDNGELWVVLGIGVFLLLVLSIGFLVYHMQNAAPLPKEVTQSNDGWIPLTPNENNQETKDEEMPLKSDLIKEEKNLPLTEGNGEIIIKEGDKEVSVKEESVLVENEVEKKPINTNEKTDIFANKSETKKTDDKNEKVQPSLKKIENKSSNVAKKTINPVKNIEKPKKNEALNSTSKKNIPEKKENKAAVNRTVQKIDKENAPLDLKKYWVQVASVTAKKRADEARSELESNKMPVNVFTYKGKDNIIYYRIRVGPYASKEEAEYWKGKISCISLFKDEKCYVTGVE